jgi:rod shape-determining protein MreD
MIKTLIYVTIGIALITVESSVLSGISMEFLKPDLGMGLVLYVTLFLGPQAGLFTAIVIGFNQEILSNAPHGSILFTKVSVFIIATFLRNKLYVDSKYSFACICGGFVIVESFIYLLLSLLAKGETRDIMNVATYALPNAVFTGFFSIFLFSLIEYLNMRLSKE